MKITRYVECAQDVEIYITLDDIITALGEATDTLPQVLRGLNSYVPFLRAIPDSLIASMTPGQRTLIHGFLQTQAARYAVAEEG